MSRVIALTNQKGGVGKTTSAVNLSASLAATHRKVLLVDLDPQGNATMGSGIDKDGCELTVYDLLVSNHDLDAVARPAGDAGYDVLPANGDLTAAEVELLHLNMKEYRLKYVLARARRRYDFILIDCPPALNMLTVNALTAADGVMIPIQCEYFALEGLTALLNTVRQVKSVLNPDLEIDGLLRTMYDGRNHLSRDVSAQLQQHFGDQVLRTIVPRNVRLAEAPSYGLPVLHYDDSSRGAAAYLALAGELLRREEARAGTPQEPAGPETVPAPIEDR